MKLELGQRVAAKIDTRWYAGIIEELGEKIQVKFDNKKTKKLDSDSIQPIDLFETKTTAFAVVPETALTMRELFDQEEETNIGPNTIYGLFLWLNEVIWESKLPIIEPKLSSMESLGRFSGTYVGLAGEPKTLKPNTAELRISRKVNEPEALRRVMCHELVHYAQAHLDGEFVDGAEAHDGSFYSWAHKIKTLLGITLTEKGEV